MMFHPHPSQASAHIEDGAHVDRDVQLGEGTRIWQLASVTRGAVLGRDCTVSPGAMLDGSRYGDRVLISGGVRCGAGFFVGNDVFLGPNVVLCNDAWPTASKDGYDDALLRDGVHWAVIVEDGVSIGANAVILPGVRIGQGAMIAAGAVVGQDVGARVLFGRDGSATPLPESFQPTRMRWAN